MKPSLVLCYPYGVPYQKSMSAIQERVVAAHQSCVVIKEADFTNAKLDVDWEAFNRTIQANHDKHLLIIGHQCLQRPGFVARFKEQVKVYVKCDLDTIFAKYIDGATKADLAAKTEHYMSVIKPANEAIMQSGRSDAADFRAENGPTITDEAIRLLSTKMEGPEDTNAASLA